ncbi:hypothetical protein [Luedemannella flava]|uniref:hypothetical protein n=1 Tax=Luedemannella flava TaxID=349316 RepID=UPI0031DDB46E
MLRRPGMYGGDEVAELLLFEAMAAVDGVLERWTAERESLRASGLCLPTGVRGAYGDILPALGLRDAVASVYAQVAHRLGWLDLDRALSPTEFRRLRAEVEDWVRRDRTATELTETFGRPSVRIGGRNPFYPHTLVYATEDGGADLICFHLWNSLADAEPGTGPRGVYPEPVVLAVRHRAGPFADAFSFTPEGTRRRPEVATAT